MLNFQIIPTKQDLREAAAIERRRRNEEQRKCRIFNVRNRVIGVDTDALGDQIKEKHRIAEDERRRQLVFDQQRVRDDQLAIITERQIQEEKKRLNQEINSFRQYYQRPEDRREFDIYDPNSLKKEIPVRIQDDDPRCGVSSAQKFEGEDLAKPERRRLQTDQQRQWLQQQMRERRRAEEERRRAEDAYQAAMVARDVRACQLDRIEQDCRRRLQQTTEEYNRVLASEQEAARRMEARRDAEDAQAEQYNHLTSDMLTENPDCAVSALGAPHVVTTAYRGMSDEERAAIRREQLRQTEARRVEEEAQKRQQAEWDALAVNIAKAMELKQRELDRMQRDINKRIMEDNVRLEEEQKAQREYFEKVVDTNVPTPTFFEMFGTSSR
ncbi:RIB43A-like with coiled-coils protein 2 [Frankliniella occidentalis]|uniref:RIB43A-like with coiled-coils protein 2 n=1 Tax=Frankliniella occidentalis TaxID=133901 RepID=A0A6J1SGI6_FRAOC|nr:RIB43A-like with coiled-coils protein 2 [Frankliniella occidentalis]